MSTKLEKLFYSIELMDKTSAGVNKIMAKFDQLQTRAQKGMTSIATGAGGLMATGFALKSMMTPSIEMNKRLGDVRSLDVNEKSLGKLSQTALMHSMKYGESASAFVGASYDIQSAISGLTGNELSSFTGASAVLAKATKSDVSIATNYTGTMYGIFQNHAKQMGKAQWVEVLAGQTATAVQMFKTTGGEMSAAFTSIGAEATAGGIAMNEQMAILGTLQATMSGSEAGTKYKAFIGGIGKAQDQLGLKFTDTAGNMLPMINILEKLKGRFGDTFDVAESDALKKAFGTQEAVSLIKLLMQDTDGLATNIDKLGQVKGMEKAEKMAKANTNIWDRFGKTIEAITIAFGMGLQPALDPILDMLAAGGATVVRWTQLFPNLTKYVGIATLGIFGLIAGVSLLALIGGIGTLAMTGLTVLMPILNAGAWLASAGLTLLKGVVLASQFAFYALSLAVSTASLPILAIIAAVAALAAGAYFLYTKWDDLTTSFMNSDGLKTVIGWINVLIDKINLIPGIDISNIALPANTEQLHQSMAKQPTASNYPGELNSSIPLLSSGVANIANDDRALKPFNISSVLLPAISPIISPVVDAGEYTPMISPVISPTIDTGKNINTIAPSIDVGSKNPLSGGGSLLQKISNSVANNQSSVNVEKIEMNGTDKNGADLWDELQMAGA